MKILISGAGVAGPTLAYWLAHFGFEPTIVEKAPALRTGGYIIDFWGAGFDIADRMGLLPELREKGYVVQELRVVNRNGERIAGFPVDVIAQATGGRYISLPRSELSASIFGKLDGKVETIFGDSITPDRADRQNRPRRVRTRAGTRVRSRDRRRWTPFASPRAGVRRGKPVREISGLQGCGV